MQSNPSHARLYGTIWRWHFYAGLFVLPFIIILSITGAIYLFKPQIDRWEESPYRGLGTAGAVSADRQLAAVEAANPGAQFTSYRLPRQPGDAAMVLLQPPTVGSARPMSRHRAGCSARSIPRRGFRRPCRASTARCCSANGVTGWSSWRQAGRS
jgi:uncharacterized iron-regulated membrane protein